MSICPEWAQEEFERCSPWIQDALDESLGAYNLEHVWGMIESGRAQIWPTPNACMVTLVDDYPTGIRILNGWLAGGDLDEILHTIPKIEKWATEANCDHVTIGGRRGWLRKLPTYSEKYTVITKRLK